VFAALDMQLAVLTRHIVICGLFGVTAFFHIILQTAVFSGKKLLLHIKYVF
jgi:hypothetical protein